MKPSRSQRIRPKTRAKAKAIVPTKHLLLTRNSTVILRAARLLGLVLFRLPKCSTVWRSTPRKPVKNVRR